ncbi:MAG: UvrB/UvrC motif-containing protein, partial [Bacilli bacterium]
ITPTTIIKEIRDVISNISEKEETGEKLSRKEKQNLIIKIEKEMMNAAKELDFERATELRDILFELKGNI